MEINGPGGCLEFVQYSRESAGSRQQHINLFGQPKVSQKNNKCEPTVEYIKSISGLLSWEAELYLTLAWRCFRISSDLDSDLNAASLWHSLPFSAMCSRIYGGTIP